MGNYIVYDPQTGDVLRVGVASDSVIALQAQDGEAVTEAPGGVIRWPDLDPDPLRPFLWAKVKTRRDAVINGGAPSPAGRVDSDMLSRANITGAVLAALMAQQAGSAFSINWTLLDNSVVTLDAGQVIAMGEAVMAHVNAAHDRARGLRAMIDGAADIAGLLRVIPGMEEGWPS